MTQLALPFGGYRAEFPPFRMTWIDDSGVRVVMRGEHCIDFGWKWWTHGLPS